MERTLTAFRHPGSTDASVRIRQGKDWLPVEVIGVVLALRQLAESGDIVLFPAYGVEVDFTKAFLMGDDGISDSLAFLSGAHGCELAKE